MQINRVIIQIYAASHPSSKNPPGNPGKQADFQPGAAPGAPARARHRDHPSHPVPGLQGPSGSENAPGRLPAAAAAIDHSAIDPGGCERGVYFLF